MPQKAPKETDRALGRRIIAFRKASGMSQTALGQAVGVTFQQIQKYEKGTNRVGASRVQNIARALGVSVSDLYNENPDNWQNCEEAFSYLKTNGAIDLLRAYAEIEDEPRRRDVLSIVCSASRLKGGTQKPIDATDPAGAPFLPTQLIG